MFSNVKGLIHQHFKSNINLYFFLILVFIAGVSAGAFTVNGLSTMQRDELTSYFQGFTQLMENQKVNSNELIKISVMENMKVVVLLWVLGVTIIGIPFIFIIIGIKGFVTGFSSGFVIGAMGTKGVLFTALTLMPKEIVMIPCIIALGVNGINFSLNMIKNKSMKRISKESIKSDFAGYCFVTMFFSSFLFIGILIEAFITPVFMRMLTI